MTPIHQQQSFDAMGLPLSDVTFCVLDIETTGGSAQCAITEIGAVKLRGGELLNSFQTLLNPGVPIPPTITVLTGITEAMVAPAPYVGDVLETFLDFVGDAVIVGHNVRFDLRFLNAALREHGYEPFSNVVVDTCSLARRLVRDEVRNCKLHTLAEHFRLRHQPSHRALDDAEATGELLHCLLERAGSLGVYGLADLVALPTVGAHPNFGKLTLTNHLPRVPGVYLFRNTNGDVLYVGKANNLRQRVRSYFNGDDRRKVGRLLHEVTTIDAEKCINEFAASIREIRLIHEHSPHYNAQVKNWRKYVFVALTLEERYPRFVVARNTDRDDRLYLGPLSSKKQAEHLIEALQSISRLRRCTKLPKVGKPSPCLAAQLSTADCPCSGEITAERYRVTVDNFVAQLTMRPNELVDLLLARMGQLAEAERFEDAATARDRADLLVRVLTRGQQMLWLRRTPVLDLQAPDHSYVRLIHGKVDSVGLDPPLPTTHQCTQHCPNTTFVHPRDVDELLYVSRFMEKFHKGLRQTVSDETSEFVISKFPMPAFSRITPRPAPVGSSVTRRYAEAVA